MSINQATLVLSSLYLTADVQGWRWSLVVLITSLYFSFCAKQFGLGSFSVLFAFLGALAPITIAAEKIRNAVPLKVKLLVGLLLAGVLYYYYSQGKWYTIFQIVTGGAVLVVPLLATASFLWFIDMISFVCYCLLPSIGFTATLSPLLGGTSDYFEVFVNNPAKLLESATWVKLLENIYYPIGFLVGCILLRGVLVFRNGRKQKKHVE